jgi:hypothetical protein
MKAFKAFVLVVFFPKHVIMLQLIRKFTIFSYLFQSNLDNHICGNVQLGLKNMGRANRNKTRLVQIVIFTQES